MFHCCPFLPKYLLDFNDLIRACFVFLISFQIPQFCQLQTIFVISYPDSGNQTPQHLFAMWPVPVMSTWIIFRYSEKSSSASLSPSITIAVSVLFACQTSFQLLCFLKVFFVFVLFVLWLNDLKPSPITTLRTDE